MSIYAKLDTKGKTRNTWKIDSGPRRYSRCCFISLFNYIGVSVMYHEADVHTALVSAIIVTLPVDALARFNQQRDASRHLDYFPLFQHSQFWQEVPTLTLNMWWKNQLKGVCNHPRWMSTSMNTYSCLQFHPPIGLEPCHWRLRAGSAARMAFIFSTHEVLRSSVDILNRGWHRWHKHVVSFGFLSADINVGAWKTKLSGVKFQEFLHGLWFHYLKILAN